MRRCAYGRWNQHGEDTNDMVPSIPDHHPHPETTAWPTFHSTWESNHNHAEDTQGTKERKIQVGYEKIVCTRSNPTRTKTSWKKPPPKIAPGRGFAATTTNHATSSQTQSAPDMEHGPGTTENAREKAKKQAEKLKKGMYKLTFVTGVRRGAGTKARARVVLCGETGKSESFLLGGRDDDAGGFITGSRRVYYVNTSNNLGEIYRVDVELADYSIAEVGCRWFLDQVRKNGDGDAIEKKWMDRRNRCAMGFVAGSDHAEVPGLPSGCICHVHRTSHRMVALPLWTRMLL